VIGKRWLLVPPLLLAAAVGGAVALSSSRDRASLDELRDFDEFALFYAGDSVQGNRLERVLSSAGGVTFLYGTCDAGRDGGCAPPVQVQVVPICSRPYRGSALSPTLTSVRGAPALVVDGRLEIQTADATVVVFAEHPVPVAAALRGVNNRVVPGAPLPKPAPGTRACWTPS
jgi:hypothetical protein